MQPRFVVAASDCLWNNGHNIFFQVFVAWNSVGNVGVAFHQIITENENVDIIWSYVKSCWQEKKKLSANINCIFFHCIQQKYTRRRLHIPICIASEIERQFSVPSLRGYCHPLSTQSSLFATQNMLSFFDLPCNDFHIYQIWSQLKPKVE